MKKVSILLPTYNAEPFIRDCLQSILSQDYANIEIIVSDDASTDRTVEIVKKFSSLYPGVIDLNVNAENLGITKNCNRALAECDGDYICLFAGDDVMLPGKISEQVSLLEADREASLCYHRVEVFNHDDGRVIEITESSRTIFSVFDIIEKGGLPGANSVMARRTDLPVQYNTDIPAVSDWLFFIEIALRGKIIFSSKILARYRKHRSGCSSKADLLIGETLETVNHILRRFNGSARIAHSCRRAKIRYLLGSVARLVLSKNDEQLSYINNTYIRDLSLILFISVRLYCRTGLINTSLGKYLFSVAQVLMNRRIR